LARLLADHRAPLRANPALSEYPALSEARPGTALAGRKSLRLTASEMDRGEEGRSERPRSPISRRGMERKTDRGRSVRLHSLLLMIPRSRPQNYDQIVQFVSWVSSTTSTGG